MSMIHVCVAFSFFSALEVILDLQVDPSNILRYALYIATLFIASTVSIALALGFIQISSYTRQAYLSFREFIYSRTSVDNSHKLDRIQGRVEEIYDIVSEIRQQNRQILRDSSITITPPIPPLPDILVTPPSPQGQQLTPSRPTYPLPTTPSTPDTTRTPFPGGFNIPSYIPASPTGATDGSNSPGIQQFYVGPFLHYLYPDTDGFPTPFIPTIPLPQMEGSSYRGIVGVQMSPARGPSLSPLWVPLQTPPFHYGILYPGNFTPQDHSTPAQTSYPLPGREQEPPSAQPPSSNSSKVQSQRANDLTSATNLNPSRRTKHKNPSNPR
ncbi:hypothetical protein AX16_008609 [Volvariella volvacea WC 439]|nr:hypothetical protein AX16_008609 [Volvariella volvacea WC 439]